LTVFLSLMAALSAGTSDFLGGLAARRVAAARVTMLGHVVGIAVGAVLLAVIDGTLVGSDLAWGAAGGIAGAAGLVSIYAGYARARVAIAAPLAGVGTAAIPVVVGALRGDDLSAAASVGIAVGLVAIGLTSLARGESQGTVAASLLYGLGGAVGLGLLLLLLAESSDDGGMWPLVAARVGGSVALLLVVVVFVRDAAPAPTDGQRVPARAWPLILGVGLLGTSANGMFIVASREGSTAVAAVLVSLFPAVTVLWAWIVFGERLRAVQLTGLGLALVAIALIAAG